MIAKRKGRCVICKKRIWLGSGTQGSKARCQDCEGRQKGDPPHDGHTCEAER